MPVWSIVFYLLSLFPLCFVIALMSFYSKATKVLGQVPTYNKPDPKELDFYNLYAPYIDTSAEVWLYSLLLWILLLIIYLILKRKQIRWAPLVISAASQLVALLLMFSGIMEWYLD